MDASLSLPEKFTDKEVAGFLLEDYKQKIAYLTAHFQRLWTRFNFFVTIEAAVAAFMFTSNRTFATFALDLIGVEVAVTLMWWVFGAEDRFLVRVYRKQVRDAADKLMNLYRQGYDAFPAYLGDYRYVGDVEDGAKDILEEDRALGKSTAWSPFEWRSPSISITRLAAIFPVVILVLWIIVGVILYTVQ
jgi:hypothetical protein